MSEKSSRTPPILVAALLHVGLAVAIIWVWPRSAPKPLQPITEPTLPVVAAYLYKPVIEEPKLIGPDKPAEEKRVNLVEDDVEASLLRSHDSDVTPGADK